MQVGKGRIVRVTGLHSAGRTATVLLRGSNKLVLEEAERSLHDALCVVRCLVHKRFLIAGGSAPEAELNFQLTQWAKQLQVRPAAHSVLWPAIVAQSALHTKHFCTHHTAAVLHKIQFSGEIAILAFTQLACMHLHSLD